jgi:hypothetical protein
MTHLRRRLERLERHAPGRPSRCPDCLPVPFVTEDADGNLAEGAYPKRCRSCDGPHDSAMTDG